MNQIKTSTLNGNPIYYSSDHTWRYISNNLNISDEAPLCPKCHKPPTTEGYDFCLQKLPGITHACRGHGISPGYLIFENGVKIEGNFTISLV